MALGREIGDFLGAFRATTSIGNNIGAMRDRRNKKKINDPTNPATAAGAWANAQAAAPPAPGAPAVPMQGTQPTAMGTSEPAVPDVGSTDQIPAATTNDDYAEGGDVLPPYEPPGNSLPPPQLPAYEQPGQSIPPGDMTAPGREPPVPLPPSKPAGSGAVDASQTRTAAYDPETEGPAVSPTQSAPAAASGAPAVPLNSAPPTNDAMGGGDGSLSTNNVRSDLERALHGAMTFAQETFHLNDKTDPHHEGGKQALFSGVGAAPHDQVQAMDEKINKGVSADPQLYAVRRLEAIYRWYSMNGKSTEANKAAFELVQYTAGVAAQWGDRAAKQAQAGDMPGAIRSVQEGYNYIPDGRKMQVQGNTATIVDTRTGKPVDQFQFTPQQVFGAAMGLSNRSLYWNTLVNRVGQTGSKPSNRTESQQDLDRARAENIRARTGKLKAGPAGGSGHSAAFDDLVKKIEAEEPNSPKGSAPPQQAAPAQGSNDDDPESGEPGMASGESNAELESHDAPVGQIASPAPPASVLRTKPGTPDQVATPPVTNVGPSVPIPERIPATADHPGFEPHYETPDRVPDVKIAHDGEKYVPGSDVTPANQFDEEAPKPNPYRKYEADAAKIPGKEGVAIRQLIQKKAAAYEATVKDYNTRKKAFDASEKTRVTSEGKASTKDTQKAMAHYDQSFKPHELEKAEKDVSEAWDTAAKKAVYPPGAAFNDPTSTEAKAAAEANKDNFASSIFGDKTVSADKLRNVAVSLMTSNPNMTAEKAVRLVHQLSTIDPQDATKRTYAPVGRDVTASKNIVVKPADGSPYKFSPVHIRQDAYDDLTGIVQQRLKAGASRGKQAALSAAQGAESGTSGDSKKIVDKAKGIVTGTAKGIVDKATTVKPSGDRGLIGDVKQGAVDLGGKIKDIAKRIPFGDGKRIEETIRNYPPR